MRAKGLFLLLLSTSVALAAGAQSVDFPISSAAGVPQKPAVVHLPPGVYRLEKPIVLKPESSAFKLGFVDFDQGDIGPRKTGDESKGSYRTDS